VSDPHPTHPSQLPGPTGEALAAGALFAWSGGGIVLFAERLGERWVLARGWREADRLAHVRRWSFAEPRALAGQVRRLADEATGDRALAVRVAAAAAAWTAAHGPSAGAPPAG
jgi:hypothetical protein